MDVGETPFSPVRYFKGLQARVQATKWKSVPLSFKPVIALSLDLHQRVLDGCWLVLSFVKTL